MNQSSYLSKFSLAARWRLSYQEAGEAVSDYEDLFRQSGKDEAEVCRDLGDPYRAARLLTVRSEYGVWLAVFCVLLLPVLLLFLFLLSYMPLLGFLLSPTASSPRLVCGLAACGAAAALVWFRPVKGFEDGKIPRPLLLVLGLMLLLFLAAAAALSVFYQQMNRAGISARFARGLLLFLEGAGFFAALLGVYSIVKSRISDRRWRAVYLLTLPMLLVSVYFLQILLFMDLPVNLPAGLHVAGADRAALSFIMGEFKNYLFLGCAGLLGAGVSLC